jgi:DNA gyrase inhibitor GyrI
MGEKIMSDIDVRIVKLNPMRVASFYGFGKSPEMVAWEKLKAWASPKSLIDNSESYRTFGFNNPNPSSGSPNYGYELWLPIGNDVVPEGDIRVQDFSGGLYAVTRFKGLDNIGEVWKKLVTWQEKSHYKQAYHQWLEELLVDPDTPIEEYVFDLYLPIAK